MLSAEEKAILGKMVDMGQLRGEERVSAGADDKIARELIATFKEQLHSLQKSKDDLHHTMKLCGIEIPVFDKAELE